MARGDAELACLSFVRECGVSHMYSAGYILKDKKNWYGLHYVEDVENDPVLISDIVMRCVPNPELNKFPDFVYESGFVEHFKVSASDLGNFGFASMVTENTVRKNSQRKIQARNESAFDADPATQLCVSHDFATYRQPVQTYDMFCESFRSHWGNHIGSLHNYGGVKDVGVFLIECPDVGFVMHEDVSADYPKKNVHVGSLRKDAESFHSLRLSRCPDLLEYMHGYRDEVKYVIYVCSEAIEFFRTDELMYIKNFVRHPYLKYGCPGYGIQGNVGIMIRNGGGD